MLHANLLYPVSSVKEIVPSLKVVASIGRTTGNMAHILAAPLADFNPPTVSIPPLFISIMGFLVGVLLIYGLVMLFTSKKGKAFAIAGLVGLFLWLFFEGVFHGPVWSAAEARLIEELGTW